VCSLQQSVVELFALVSEALARATWALINSDAELARGVVEADAEIDSRTAALEARLWAEIDAGRGERPLREAVAVLLILPELERSADLAEHIAQRAQIGLGAEMSPASRGVVQRMSEVAVEMWQVTTAAFADGSASTEELDLADEELDALHERLTGIVAEGGMDPAVSAQVTLLSRFYERLGDHAVNLSRRVGSFSPPAGSPPATPGDGGSAEAPSGGGAAPGSR
jgi:phosphate transport system protein